MCMQPLATKWLVIRNTAKQLEMKVQEAEGTERLTKGRLTCWGSFGGSCEVKVPQKITVCGFNPYALRKSDFSENIELLPNIQYPDIVKYLVVKTSWATKTQMKAYKSMEAYHFFMFGWVNTLCMVFSCWGSAVEADVRISDSTTCTQEKNKWLLPSHMKEIPYLPVIKAVLSLVTPFSEQYTCREIDNVPKPLPNNLFKEEFMLLDFMELLQQCQQILL
ncbi:hypothetical protein pdam_00002869 [Pocillopora damicornis]|uniref:Uncharacterized protein n=1 Tax=Pocillopora damicornis TaxID=46731 RepID=A0A3M6U8R4_POCDA|nr:hypothetical protein pdam_00002869 [Pocillopora damicornis]